MALPQELQDWFIPLSEGRLTLAEARAELATIGFPQDAIPLIVQLVENPKYDLPGVELFDGAADLDTHDNIHILLGRGLLPKDEAFVLGFTMGSTNRVGAVEEKLYELFSRYLYPHDYRFSREDFAVYRDALRLGQISGCEPLHSLDYEALMSLDLACARRKAGIEVDLLRASYRIEKRRHPQAPESRRLLARPIFRKPSMGST